MKTKILTIGLPGQDGAVLGEIDEMNRLKNTLTIGDVTRVADNVEHIDDSADQITLKAIYRPKGEALEYASYGLNLYGGCSHGCTYCYNKFRFRRQCESRIMKSTLENIRSDLMKLASVGNRDPVHLSFVGDPYDQGREDNSYTRRVLGLFREYNQPFRVLTKGGLKATKDFDLYGPDDWFGVTLTFDNDADSRTWEPGAAPPADRVEALRRAHERGIKTWVSMEPVICPDQTLHLIEATHEYVDHYGVGRLNHNELANQIDWRKFRVDAEALLMKHCKDYMIKASLREST